MPTSKRDRPKPPPRPAQAPSAALAITGARQFEQEVLGADVPVVVDFWAPWCVPCRAMAPVFESAATRWAGRVKFVKLDTERVPSVAQKLQITSIPTLLVFHHGEVVDVRIGVTPGDVLDSMAQRARDKHDGVGFLDKLKRSFGFGGAGKGEPNAP